MRISDRSSDVCSSDLGDHARGDGLRAAHSSHGTGDQCCHAGSDWRIRASRDPSAGDACPDCGPDCDLRCPVRLRYQPSAQHVAKTMEFLDNLALGFSVALDPMNLVYCLIGVSLGTFIGLLPGVGPLVTIAVLLPLPFGLTPEGGLIILAGIYYGAAYGGSTNAIRVNQIGRAHVCTPV